MKRIADWLHALAVWFDPDLMKRLVVAGNVYKPITITVNDDSRWLGIMLKKELEGNEK